jgi:hypothetical protein
LFGEADDPLGALRWCLSDLRRCCDGPGLLRGDPVSLAAGSTWLDVWALRGGSGPAAEIGGVLLDGAEPRGRVATWLMMARGRCEAQSMAELRQAVLRILAAADAEAAGRAAALDRLDEGTQELLLRALVAAAHPARAGAHLASCEGTFARERLPVSPALRAAAWAPAATPRAGRRAGAVARSLLRAGTTATDAGSAGAGIETLRRARASSPSRLRAAAGKSLILDVAMARSPRTPPASPKRPSAEASCHLDDSKSRPRGLSREFRGPTSRWISCPGN